MPNEIYHRSNWGESKAEGFGDVYYDHAATNKLYNHSDYYENSDGTDATLKDLNNKASIVLTPTAYSDGSLNTVIPPYQETLKFSGFSSFSVGSSWEVENDVATTDGLSFSNLSSLTTVSVGKKYRAVFTTTGGSIRFYFGGSGDTPYTVAAGTHTLIGVAESNKVTFRNLSTAASISNFTLTEIQEADFDFSRGSSATRVNEQGLVEDVQILSGELVQNGDFEQIGSELVTNGSFDTDSDWDKLSGATISNGQANLIFNGLGNPAIKQNMSISVGKTYKFVFYVTEWISGNLEVFVSSDTRSGFVTINGVGQYEITLKINTVSDVRFVGSGTTSNFSIDNVSVKEVGQNWTVANDDTNNYVEFNQDEGTVRLKFLNTSPLTTLSSDTQYLSGKKYKLTVDVKEVVSGSVKIDAAGVSQTYNSVGVQEAIIEPTGNSNISFYRATADVDITLNSVSLIEITDDTDLPRIDYTDGTGSLLLEPQSTNLVGYSLPNNTNWSKGSNTTITENYAASPDGTQNASRLVMPTGSGTYAYYQFTATSTTDHTLSFYAKNNGGGADVTMAFFVASQTQNITLTNEWQRFEFTTSITSGNVVQVGVDNITSVDMLIFGVQCEALPYATSYIPTSGSTVTRSADVANNSGNADLFNDSEGVLYAEISALTDTDTTNPNRGISISSGSTNNTVFIYYQSALNRLACILISNGTTQFSHSTALFDVDDYLKIALKYKQNDFALWVNGTEIVTDTGGSAPIGLNELAFDNGVGADNFYGNVKCVAVFKEALSNDLLERLTGEGYESFRLLAEANNYTII